MMFGGPDAKTVPNLSAATDLLRHCVRSTSKPAMNLHQLEDRRRPLYLPETQDEVFLDEVVEIHSQ